MKSVFRIKKKLLLEKAQEKCAFCFPDKFRVLYNAKNFYILLSLGQIVEGYSLICAKSHYFCLGNIPAENIGEFIKVKKIIKMAFKKIYNTPTLFYEHGQSGTSLQVLINKIKTHCYHAHLHALPIKLDILELIKEKVPRYIKIKKIEELIEIRNKKINGGGYLFYENNQGKKFVFSVEGIEIPQQFLRRCVATKIGKPYLYNWKYYPGWRRLKSAYKKLRPFFERYENKKIR